MRYRARTIRIDDTTVVEIHGFSVGVANIWPRGAGDGARERMSAKLSWWNGDVEGKAVVSVGTTVRIGARRYRVTEVVSDSSELEAEGSGNGFETTQSI